MGVEKGMESFLIFHWGGEELQLGDLRITPGEGNPDGFSRGPSNSSCSVFGSRGRQELPD